MLWASPFWSQLSLPMTFRNEGPHLTHVSATKAEPVGILSAELATGVKGQKRVPSPRETMVSTHTYPVLQESMAIANQTHFLVLDTI